MRIGLTGGIGSGKSTVAGLLAGHGMVVLDADRVARDVVAPGLPALDAIVEAFGHEMLTDAGELDRPSMAALVFDDADARARLEAITHPAIQAELARRSAAAIARDPDAIVVVDHPLLIETGQVEEFDAVVVVVAPREVRLRRLVDHRGMDVEDARARMATQVDDDLRRRVGTWVVDNQGSLEDLQRAVRAVAADIRNCQR